MRPPAAFCPDCFCHRFCHAHPGEFAPNTEFMKIGSFIFGCIGPVAAISPLQNKGAGNFVVNRTNAKILRLGIRSNQRFLKMNL